MRTNKTNSGILFSIPNGLQPDEDEHQAKPAKRAKLEDHKEGTTSPLDLAQLKHYGENSKGLVDGLMRIKISLATKI